MSGEKTDTKKGSEKSKRSKGSGSNDSGAQGSSGKKKGTTAVGGSPATGRSPQDGSGPRRGKRSEHAASAASSNVGRVGVGLSLGDRAIDHELALLSRSFRFLLDITPVNVEEARAEFLATGELPEFHYRDLEDDPEVLRQVLKDVPIRQVNDAVLGTLLREKHREMELQIEMLDARDTADFMPLSIQLYGAITPGLRETADHIMRAVPAPEAATSGTLDAQQLLRLAHEEIDSYRDQDSDIEVHAEIRKDVSGVMTSGETLLMGPESKVQKVRAHALMQHEVGTHLVTHVNGTAQPIKVLGSGLSGYDETQEGLAVLAEVAIGGLTAFRLRQLAARVITVHRMVTGASFREAHEALVDDGIPASSAFTTTMRAFRSGGMTKDAIYLRGMLDLIEHLREGGTLDLLLLGKFSLKDLPLMTDLQSRGVLEPPRIRPRWLADDDCVHRLGRVTALGDPAELANS